MKPIVIAGSGPSFLKIDRSRLPRDFDVFRCNQFYLEDQYFLGKKIKGVFFNPQIFKEQYFTLYCLQERGEYEVEDVYCNWAFKSKSSDWNGELDRFNQHFPHIKNTYTYLEKLPLFLNKDRFYRAFYHQWPTSGIVMLITAIAQGYKEIYLTGIDFYMGGGVDYAFDVKNKKIGKLLPSFELKNFQSSVHSHEIDREFIKMAFKTEGIKLYAISPDSPLCEIIPLAPVQNKKDYFKVLPKPQGYICDLIDLPENYRCENPSKLLRKIKKILLEANLYDQVKENIFFIFVRDFVFCLKVIIILIRGIGK